MKKIFLFTLALFFVMAFTGCERSTEITTSADVARFESGSLNINKDELPRFRIAFVYGDWESVLGTQFMFAIQYLSDAFNVEPVFAAAGSGEEGVNMVESLLAAGNISGIVSAAGWDIARMEVANRYRVPVVTACQFPSDREIGGLASYPGFLGGVTDDEVWAGYHAMKGLYDAGSRAVTWSGLTVGWSQGHDDRTAGALRFVAEHSDMRLLTESYTAGRWNEDVASFAAVFTEMDGMAFTAIMDSVFNAMINEGIYNGSVKIAGPDVASMTGDGFRRGIQVWSCGGQYATAMISWAVLYNYLIDGTVIIQNPRQAIARNYLEITSLEEFDQYQSIIASTSPVYTVQEIANLIRRFNPNITYNDFVRLGQEYSLEDILRRRR